MSTQDAALDTPAPQNEDGSPFAALDPTARVGTTIADPHSERVSATAVSFDNSVRGTRLAGILYRPAVVPADAELPAVVVQGPMLSIKEQTAGLYAQRIASLGYWSSPPRRRTPSTRPARCTPPRADRHACTSWSVRDTSTCTTSSRTSPRCSVRSRASSPTPCEARAADRSRSDGR